MQSDRSKDPRLLFPPLISICREAGEEILRIYATPFDVDFKEDSSPLTEADRRSHRIITQRLADTEFAGGFLPVVSEEGRDIPYGARKAWPLFWLVDPLDGTKEFVGRNGEFTINIALICGNRPALGVIYVPVRDVMYLGLSGVAIMDEPPAPFVIKLKNLRAQDVSPEECLQRGERLSPGPPIPGLKELIFSMSDAGVGQMSPVPDRTILRIAGSRSHSGREFRDFLSGLESHFKEVQVSKAGSALKFCLVAEGNADLYPRFGPTWEWDTAAGHAIVGGVGRKVYQYGSGKELEYNKEGLKNGCFVCF